MNIENWLLTFKSSWSEKDLDSVLNLFTDDVEYWETPYQQIKDKTELRKEWEGIYNQSDISINLNLFSKENNKYTVIWELSFKDNENNIHKSKGIYLVELNSENKCSYFLQNFHQNS